MTTNTNNPNLNQNIPAETSNTSGNQEDRFSQIWNRDASSDQKISEVAERLATNVGDVSVKPKKPKTWGFFDWVKNLLLFIVVSSVVSVIALGFYAPNSGDPNDLLSLTTDPSFLLVNAISMYIVWIGGMFWVTYRKGERSFVKDFKLSFKKWDVFIGLGIAAGLYVIMFGAQLLFSNVLGFDLTGADNGAIFTSLTGFWFVVIAVGIASILGPFCEELWFRGFLMQSILKTIKNRREKLEKLEITAKTAPISWGFVHFFEKIRYPFAVIVSSAIFGFFHFQGSFDGFGYWFIIIATGTLGAVFAIAALYFKRLGPGIFGHIFYNFSTLIIAVTFMQ